MSKVDSMSDPLGTARPENNLADPNSTHDILTASAGFEGHLNATVKNAAEMSDARLQSIRVSVSRPSGAQNLKRGKRSPVLYDPTRKLFSINGKTFDEEDYQSAVDSYQVKENKIHFYTTRANLFVMGQSVIVTGCGDADGTYTVDARTSNTYMFSAALVAADTLSTIPVIPAGIAVLDGSSAADLYANTDAIKNALLGLSTDIFQAIIAPGSQIEGVDFAQTIYRTGRSMINRQFGLLAPYIDTETICQ